MAIKVGRDTAPADPQVRTVRIELSLRSVFTIIAIAASLWVLVRIWQILLVLVIALVLAGSLSPVVDWLEHRRIKRGLALAIVFLSLLLAVVGIGLLVIPALVGQVSDAITNAPAYRERLAEQLGRVPQLADQAQRLREASFSQYLAPIGAYALSLAGDVATVIAYGVTVVVLAFYLLADRERVQGFAYALIPRAYHLRVARVLLSMEKIVGGYVRGQAYTSLQIGVFVFLLLWFLGVPNALALAIFAAFTDVIPFIGSILVTVPAVLAALSVGVWQAVVVWVAISIYQEFESRIVIPRIYGQTLRLSPVAVTIALLIGGQLLGIIGALLALPLAAGIRVLVEDMRIELPGEQPGEGAQRVADDRAEAFYAERTEGASSVEAAVVATALAEMLQDEETGTTGQAEVPSEERTDALPADPAAPYSRGEPDTPPVPNPAR